METFIFDNFYSNLTEDIETAENSLFIISPYITDVADNLIKNIKENPNNLECRLLTLPPGIEYVTGASDFKALQCLKDAGFEIRTMDKLHAKIYIIDSKILYMGSANFTKNGMGIGKDPNKEIMVKRSLFPEDNDTIEDLFWNSSTGLEITEEFSAQIESLKEEYNNDHSGLFDKLEDILNTDRMTSYEKLLDYLKDIGKIKSYQYIKIGYGRNTYIVDGKNRTKVVRSGIRKEIKSCPYCSNIKKEKDNCLYYSFKISKKASKSIKRGKIASVILLLEEPDKYVGLPASFVDEEVLLKDYRDKSRGWQFKVIDCAAKGINMQIGKRPNNFKSVNISEFREQVIK